jgi:DNA invertase Pin-like site-specific DNA recombinase
MSRTDKLDRGDRSLDEIADDHEQAARHPVAGLASMKVQPQHLERLAIVYIRQSSPHQVQIHRESKARQYALVDYAAALGWSSDRVLVMDEDQGKSATSAEHRAGFQRLLAEVTMDHVGIVLGLEMSRMARSDKDWHHLLELCGVFGSLLADQDGVYDAADPNDRLLLGLKGTISSVELHTMRNRLDKGKLFKAQRGELFLEVPIGYVKLSSDKVALDPDEQVRATVRLIFDKFDEFGAASKVFRYLLQHDIRIGIRPQGTPNHGPVEWRRACRTTMYGMLHNPMYAGTYAYGRCPVDPKRKHSGRSKKGSHWVTIDQWKVVRHDQVPAYISWEQYQRNQERLRQNRTRWDAVGSPRKGTALLGGLLFCGNCGSRLNTYYPSTGTGRYDCPYHHRHGLARKCHGMRASALDGVVVQQVLRAIEPAALELSVRASEDLQRDRHRLAQNWRQKMERARYETAKAERHYRAVDPENRLVARTLEQQWEQALRAERQTEEEFNRFQRLSPCELSDEEKQRIRTLATDIPSLWEAAETTITDRKEILRALVDRVVATVQGNTEYVDLTIHWAGGFVSQHQVMRPIAGYAQLRDFDRIVERVRGLRAVGHTAAQIAEALNQGGFHPPPCHAAFDKKMVRQLLSRWGLSAGRNENAELGADEWWLSDLARELNVRPSKLRRWMRRSWVQCRRTPLRGHCVLWADREELERLDRLRAYSEAHPNTPYPPEITVAKSYPNEVASADRG